ncbi:MAG TPA: 16S rRNA (guanine(966)-N(2))-methyltransferase RsmD [Rhabdochlamydiaceae bacterium]
MSLRIIGGTFRNRPIKSPKGDRTRPTSAMLRKAVFDICQPFIEDAAFLDLFAGSGAMGIEAISRGVSHATFVDKDKHALDCILTNLKDLDIEAQCTVIAGVVPQAFKRLKNPFDIVYIDPPYGQVEISPLLIYFDEQDLLNPGAHLFVETDHALEPLALQHLIPKERRKYGNSFLYEFQKFL